MTNKYDLNDDDIELFKKSVGKTKPLKQDTVLHKPVKHKTQIMTAKKQRQETIDVEFYFSDNYQPLLQEDPIRYSKENADPDELKKLGRGFYDPELFLDLHGLTRQESKKEIAGLIATCLRERVHCASIMFGHGRNILKKQTPLWLAQHPNVICFHQAPKAFGGSAAILILFDIIE